MKHQHEWTPYSDQGRLQPFRGCLCGMVIARNGKLVDTNQKIGPSWRVTWMDLMEDAGWGQRKTIMELKEGESD